MRVVAFLVAALVVVATADSDEVQDVIFRYVLGVTLVRRHFRSGMMKFCIHVTN